MISRNWNSRRLYDPGASSLTFDCIFQTTNSSVGGFYPAIDTLLCSCLTRETDLLNCQSCLGQLDSCKASMIFRTFGSLIPSWLWFNVKVELVHFCVIMILSMLATLSHRMVRSPHRVFWFQFTLVSRSQTIKSVCFYWRPLTHLEVHASQTSWSRYFLDPDY